MSSATSTFLRTPSTNSAPLRAHRQTRSSGYDYGTNAAAAIGIPNINVFGATSSGLPRHRVTGLNSLGVDAPIPACAIETIQWVDNFTLIRGITPSRFGGGRAAFRGDFFQISLRSPRGASLRPELHLHNAPADWLRRASCSVSERVEPRVIYDFPSNRITQSFFYVQDDFKVTRN